MGFHVNTQKCYSNLPSTATLPCLLRGSFHRFHKAHQSFYAIGKIAKYGWREVFNVSMPGDWEDYLSAAPVDTYHGLKYAGPFFIRCDHGCSHGNGSHATNRTCSGDCGESFRSSRVFHKSEQQIQQAGFVFVWAGIGKDSLKQAYGSLVEIGIAHSLGKPILIAHHPQADLRDFWFAVETASAVVCAELPHRALDMMWADGVRQ